ncbi:MAG: chemotaxis protein CheR, partial [Chitinophagia bacterium]|nr:chemotaxis protein CheR [Chitinophagia bacterium]
MDNSVPSETELLQMLESTNKELELAELQLQLGNKELKSTNKALRLAVSQMQSGDKELESTNKALRLA